METLSLGSRLGLGGGVRVEIYTLEFKVCSEIDLSNFSDNLEICRISIIGDRMLWLFK